MKLSSTLFILLLMLPLKTTAENRVQYYISKYGYADTTLAHRAHQIFEKMKSVADKRKHRFPRLAVIKKSYKKSGEPLAIALPDGYIVLSQRALEMIYNNVSLSHGDTRLAFVLGHELAHLSNDDFLHFYKPNEVRQNELEADDRGFIYAAMAGYPVDKLLEQQDFFSYWEQQTFRNVIHPSSKARAKALRVRLQKLLDNLPYFHFAVRLSHFGHCDEAVYFFDEFKTHFPAREVYNNWGLCELQRALNELGELDYWLPSMLDAMTQLDDLSVPPPPRGEELTPLAKAFLTNAKEYFKLALEMEPTYLPANVNLAITTFYLGEHYEACAAIEKAHQLAPLDIEIQGMRAVMKYKKSPVGSWYRTIKLLKNLARQQPAPLSVLYNLARLGDADWQQLAQKASALPMPYRSVVCQKTVCPQQQQTPQATWDLPIALGVRTKRNKLLAQWQKSQTIRLYDLDEEFYHNDTAALLGLNLRTQMIVLKKLENLTHCTI